jgi:anhydro-N-acetylmuramic acid kinase
MMIPRYLIGLSSGSSADGVDAALMESEGVGVDLRPKLVCHLHQPYGPDLQEQLLGTAGSGSCPPKQIALLHRLLGETFAAAARQVADRASLSLQKVQCIGCPGHTIVHEPEGRFPATLPIGMAAIVAERTGVTTVHDFRSRDLAVGGQGVPLVALADHIMLRDPNESRLLIHLGGLARVALLPAGRRVHDIVGFEVGPCNILLDSLMRQLSGGRESYDAGGKYAVQGRCLSALLEAWLKHPYLLRRPPKSFPRPGFAGDLVQQALEHVRDTGAAHVDALCTATHFVAHSIAQSLRKFLFDHEMPDRLLVSGGGTRNGLLWRLLEQQLAGLPMTRTDDIGIPSDARKATASAVLAALTIDGVPGNIPAATGASVPRLLGSITPGSTINWARCLAWMAQQAAPLTAMYEV